MISTNVEKLKKCDHYVADHESVVHMYMEAKVFLNSVTYCVATLKLC